MKHPHLLPAGASLSSSWLRGRWSGCRIRGCEECELGAWCKNQLSLHSDGGFSLLCSARIRFGESRKQDPVSTMQTTCLANYSLCDECELGWLEKSTLTTSWWGFQGIFTAKFNKNKIGRWKFRKYMLVFLVLSENWKKSFMWIWEIIRHFDV